MPRVASPDPRSSHFHELWPSHDVLTSRQGPEQFHHPVVGDVEFIGESFDLSRDEDLALLPYTDEQNSPTAQAMSLLAG